MTKRRTIIAVLALVALVVGVLNSTRTREPSYNGRTLSEWLEIYQAAADSETASREGRNAIQAVRAIGTNGLPFLLARIRYKPKPWVDQFVGTFRRFLPAQFLLRTCYHPAKYPPSFTAFQGFYLLGRAGRPALPELLKIADDTNLPHAGRDAFVAIAFLGEDAVAPVCMVLTNASHPRHNDAPRAAWWMDYLGTNAAPLVPLLAKATRDASDECAQGSVEALGRLCLLPEISVPALADSLSHSNATIRRLSIESLFHFGRTATSAVPALIAARQDSDARVRGLAVDILFMIAPEVFTNAPPQ